MLLTHDRLARLAQSGVISGVRPGSINGSSIDVHLSGTFLLEKEPGVWGKVVDIAARETISFTEICLGADHVYPMPPGQFLLASTEESFALPSDISALFVMKSSVARCGLDQMNAAWCSPGWTGSTLTLELINATKYHSLGLRAGMPIGQMVFFQGDAVPESIMYSARGRFNHQMGPAKNV